MLEQYKYHTITEDIKSLIQYVQHYATKHPVIEAANRLNKAIKKKNVDVGLIPIKVHEGKDSFEIEFVPEYYSGINWRNAEHLVGKTVECTNNPDAGWSSGILMLFDTVSDDTYYKFTVKKQASLLNRIYIRTCEETFKHHPISIGGVELPMPETVAPSHGTKYWTFPGCICHIWNGFTREMDFLKAGQVHLTEERAKAWADWWKKGVLAKIDETTS